MDQESFEYLFEFRNEIFTYEAFLMAIAKFPALCGENNMQSEYTDEEMCKRELSNMFAQFVVETGYNSGWEETTNGVHVWR